MWESDGCFGDGRRAWTGGRGDRADAYAVKSEEGMGEKDGRDDASPTYLEKKNMQLCCCTLFFMSVPHLKFFLFGRRKSDFGELINDSVLLSATCDTDCDRYIAEISCSFSLSGVCYATSCMLLFVRVSFSCRVCQPLKIELRI